MKEEEIPDYNIFMMCNKLNKQALTQVNSAYHIRNCRPEELEIWKAFPFDSETIPAEYENFMDQFIEETYSGQMDTFFRNTLFACNNNDKPIATCTHWKAYGKFNSIHWLKTLKDYEGKGLGRAILSEIMRKFDDRDYPIYIHTQPGSFRAIKLYSDFGFVLLKGGVLGTRRNELVQSLPILKECMRERDYEKLKIRHTPDHFIKMMESETTIQF
ncbi:MAG: GNAT family N-acetyltransferase [Balneolaceae bacterium]|nr:GNAT family N-acetyltransferase [Balneolaceae bacterium]